MPKSSFDADAQAFITAAAITDNTQKNAINTLVIDLKSYGIWNDLLAIYPVVGGTASQHKFNLKDPRDLDVAYRLTFSTGWTHSTNGMTPNGTSAFANSFFTPSTAMPTGGDSLHYYSRTNATSVTDYLIGCETLLPTTILGLVGKRTANGRGFYVSSNPSLSYQNAQQDNLARDTRGLFSGTGNGANTYFYLKGIQLATNTTLQTLLTRATNILYLGASRSNVGTAVNFTSKECAFAGIGKEMTPTKLVDLNTIVQAYQTTLSRQV
jgi:hypothetical protein